MNTEANEKKAKHAKAVEEATARLKERRAQEDELIDQLDDEHGGVAAIRGDAKIDAKGRVFNDWLIVVKRASRPVYKIWRSMVNDPKKKDEAMEFALRQTCVYPSVDDGALDALLTRHPGIGEATETQTAFMTFVGLNAKDASEAGKL